MAALEPDQITAAMLEEMASLTLLHAVGIVNTVRVSLVVLDATLHVVMANRYFYECFQVTPQETESHRLYDLGNGQWNIPALRDLLEEIVPHHTAFDLEGHGNVTRVDDQLAAVCAEIETLRRRRNCDKLSKPPARSNRRRTPKPSSTSRPAWVWVPSPPKSLRRSSRNCSRRRKGRLPRR